jgi:3-oxoacyl-[acyl-carrier protein] reductase
LSGLLKAAMHGPPRSLARAVAAEIRVNCIAPGMVDTRWRPADEDKMHMLAGTMALNRVVSPDDIAEAVLTSMTAKAITRQIVVANMTAKAITRQIVVANNGETSDAI